MNNKTSKILSIVFMVVVSLSILAIVAAPVMAENTTAIDGEYLKGSGVCDVSIGVDSAYSKYGQYNTITFSGWIKNQEWKYVDYDMKLTLQGPGGDSWDFDGRVYYYKKNKHTVHKNPPSGGWIPGTYTICNDVKATGTDCFYQDWRCRSFKVVHSPRPDLVITDIWGDNSTIYYTIKNQGDMAAGASNTSLTIDGVFKASDYVSSLESGEKRTESFDYTWTCTGGSDILKVCADYMAAVGESNEKNNCRTKTWICKDFVITNIWTDNGTIYYKITNRGDEKVGASNTSLTIDGIFITSHYVGPLEPKEGRTESFDYTWTCTGGSDIIEVCADYMDAVEEGNEKNNCRTKTWICKDFVITDIWTDNGTIYYKITNRGDEKVGASNTSLTIDGIFITSHYVGPLEPKEGRTESFDYTWTCTGGSDILEVCADYMDAVEEGNEKNNCRTKTWICKDFVITDIWTDNGTIYYKIKNTGYEKVGASNTSLAIDGIFITSHYVGPLEPKEGRTESFDYTWICTGGSDILEVCADYMDAVEEGNEKNNCRTKTWICKDFVITDIWTDNGTIYYEIKNVGDEKVGASNTSLTIDGIFITSHYVGPLEPKEGRTESFDYTWTCTGGSDILEVCADYMDAVEEGNEENNCRHVKRICPLDISVSPTSFDLRLPPDVVTKYTLAIRNIGGGKLEFNIMDVEKKVASARASSLDTTFNNVIGPSDVTSCEHETTFGNTEDSSNRSIVIDDEYTTKSQKSSLIHFESIGAENINEEDIYYKLDTLLEENNQTSDEHNQTLKETIIDKAEPIWVIQGQNTTTIDVGTPILLYANDTTGNTCVSEPRKVIANDKMAAPQDTAPPPCITNLSHISGQTWINWTWVNPDDEDFEDVMVDINEIWQADTSDSYYNATGLVPNASYEIDIRTVGKDGNMNETVVNDTALTLTLAFSVSIISPPDGQVFKVFKQNEMIDVHCSVSGGAPPYAFNWSSSIDGFISDEESLSKPLSAGVHVISLSATDSTGLDKTASANISVVMGKEEKKIRGIATTIIVPDSYPTIQQAVDNATEGDTIFVRSGAYPENIQIDKDLTVEGEDMGATIIDGRGSGDCVRVSSADVIISGFTIKNAGNYGVYTYSSDLNINNATITDCKKDAIHFRSGKSMTLRDSVLENCDGGLIYYSYPGADGNATIERNSIRNNTGSGLYINLDGKGYEAAINDNIITNNTGYGIKCDYQSDYIDSITMENNTVRNCVNDGVYIEGAIDVDITDLIIENPGNNGLYASCSGNMVINPPFSIKNASGYGIYAYYPNFALNNATITDCGKDAIHFRSGKSMTLRDSVLENCDGGLIYYSYPGADGNATIERNSIRNNTGSGLYINLDGKGYEAAINDNIITNNTGYGIKSDYQSDYIDSITMENNTVRNCVNDGVYIEGAIDVDITDLIIENPGNNGLYASCSGNMVINPPFSIKNASGYGIYAYYPNFALNNATITDCGKDAIHFRSGKSMTLRDSVLENCDGGLIYYSYPGADGNATIERNSIRNNTGSGLYINLDGKGYEAAINDNIITNNTGYGIKSDYQSDYIDSITMENNTVRNCVNDGVYIEGAIDVDITDLIIENPGNNGLYASCSGNMVINPPFSIKNASGYGIYAYYPNFALNNATITDCGKDAIHFRSGKSMTLRDSVLENCDGGLIYYFYPGADGNATIERNSIRNNTGSGLYINLDGKGYEAAINDNIITNNTEYGIKCDYQSDYIDSITMENNTVRNCVNDGVYIEGAIDVDITDLIIENPGDDGLYASCSGNMVIKNGTVKNSGDDGIYLRGAFTPVLANNTITGSSGYGIYLYISSSTKNLGKLRNNVLTKNKYGFSITGTSIESYYHDIDTSNTINGKPIYYLVREENKILDGIPMGYLGLISCENIEAKNLELANSGQGILMVNTSDSEIYFNNFINNADNVCSYKSINIWNSTEKITYTYKEKTHINYMGNYWDDCTSVDADDDGIWDHPCPVDSDYDYYPLVEYVSDLADLADWLSVSPRMDTVDPGNQTDITVTLNTTGLDFGEYHTNITITSNDPDEQTIVIPVRLTVPTSQKGDLNYDGILTPADAAIALRIAASGAQNPAADMNDDGRITSLDALMILQAAAGGGGL